MKRTILVLLFLFTLAGLPAQGMVVDVHFKPLFNGEELVAGKKCNSVRTNDSITIDLLKFYISGIEFLCKGVVVAKEADSYHLIDLSDTASLTLHCRLSTLFSYDAIKFNLGIDSATNVSGVMGGDLDPTKGMYWTWQSGYVNFKVEGTAGKSTARGHEFQFHIGGYAAPANALRVVQLPVKPATDITVTVNMDLFFVGIDLAKENHIMSPGKDAVQLSAKAAVIFGIRK